MTEEKSSHAHMYVLAAIILIAVIVMAIAPKNITLVQSSQDKNSVMVTGSYEMEVMPDEASIYIRIETLNSDAKTAQQENSRIANDVVKALKKFGIADKDIETTEYRLYEEKEWVKNTYKTLGYKQVNVFKASTKELDKVGELTDAAVKAGANKIDGVSFQLSKDGKRKANADVLVKASENAKAKAEALANALGAKLGKISTIAESNVDYGDYYYPRAVMAMGGAESSKAMEAPTPISPEAITIRASVSLMFEIG